ncbi:MAG: DUF4382 domain-containing protein [Bacteroidota bacterium]
MKTKTSICFWGLFVLLGMAMFSSCNKSKNADSQTGNATLTVKMGDSPAGYDAVNVEILKMVVNLNGSWLEYAVASPGVYNLLQFTNGNTLLLLSPTPISPGSVSEIRLVLGNNSSIVVDGVICELQTPSGQSSGYKVKMGTQPLLAGFTYNLILDFDVNKSVHPTGNGKYILHPVVRGYLDVAVGKISGTITPVNSAYYIMASNVADTAGTYINQATGTFIINTLNPGTYNIHFYANAGYYDKEVFPVLITAGQTVVFGSIIIEPIP